MEKLKSLYTMYTIGRMENDVGASENPVGALPNSQTRATVMRHFKRGIHFEKCISE